MDRALYGAKGFYRTRSTSADHFRTSVQASPLFAGALSKLVVSVDLALGEPDPLEIVDVGAADGRLLKQLSTFLAPTVRARLRLVAVEIDVEHRSTSADVDCEWLDHIPPNITGVLIANEWLDNIPVDVAQRVAGDTVQVLVDPQTAQEQPGPTVTPSQRAWLDRWWPLDDRHSTGRAEIGQSRDTAWVNAVSQLQRGVAVAIDYSHLEPARATGAFAAGTLRGFKSGRVSTPLFDGSGDITAHVALDACAAAAEDVGVTSTVLTTQREALQSLGVDGSRPTLESANSDPALYLAELDRSSQAAELIDPEGLGDFGWLLQTRGIPMPVMFNAQASGQ